MKATAPWRGRRDALRVLGGLALAPLAQSHAQAQATSWPTRPIKVLIGVPAGGTQDVLTRAIADAVKTSLGPIIIDNRGGAAGRIAVEAVKNAEPDGYTLLLGTAGMMTMFPNAYKKLGYDPVKDFVPIVNAASFELAMTVHSRRPGDDGGRVRCLGEDARDERRERQLRVVRRRHAVALPRRDAQPSGRPEDGPRSLQGIDAGAPGRDGRNRAALFRYRRRRLDDAADRAHQGAGDERRQTRAADAGGADLRRARLQGRHRDGVVLVLRAGADAAGDRRAAALGVPEGGQFARGSPAARRQRHVPGRRRPRRAAEDDARRHRALGPDHAGDELLAQAIEVQAMARPTSSSSSPTTSASPISAATAAAFRFRPCSTGWPPKESDSRRAMRTRRSARRRASRS